MDGQDGKAIDETGSRQIQESIEHKEHAEEFRIQNFGTEDAASDVRPVLSEEGERATPTSPPLGNDSLDGCSSSNKRWSEAETKLIISLYKTNQSLFLSPQTNQSVWAKIAKKFGEKGYSVTGEQCDTKFKNLRKNYKSIVDANQNPGSGPIDWPYFDLMDAVFGNKPDVKPVSSASSTRGAETSVPTSSASSSLSLDEEPAASATATATREEATRKRKAETSDEPPWFTSYKADMYKRYMDRIEMQNSMLAVFQRKADKK